MNNRWTLIDTPLNLTRAEPLIREAKTIALDTEYDSFRYFREKLCLVQVQNEAGTWLIDPMAEGLDLSFLGEILADPEILKIFHAGDNDIRILKREYGFAFRNIFDTHRAAALLGFRQLSLSTLVETHLGIALKKGMQRSRWDLRPLSGEQLDYAALDTAYLTALYRKLDAELHEKGLAKEAKRIFEGIAEVVWKPRVLDRIAHRKITGFAHLSAEQKERLRLLCRWRFEKAEEINRACFMLLSDLQLIALAKVENASVEKIVGPGLLSTETANRFGPEIVALLREPA